MWVARYGCGCTEDAPTKRELLEYCGKHGHDRKEILKVPKLYGAGKPRKKALTKKEIDALVEDDDLACGGRII